MRLRNWDDSYLHRAIHTALNAHGVGLCKVEQQGKMASVQKFGCQLRDEIFPKHLPGFIDAADFQAVAQHNPDLWNMLPYLIGVGFLRTSLFHRVENEAYDDLDSVSVLGALFHTTITVLDQLVDEYMDPASVFALVNPALLYAIFQSDEASERLLCQTYTQTVDPQLRLLLMLIATFAKISHTLHDLHGNNDAWQALNNLIRQMYEAQRRVTGTAFPSRAEMADLLPLVHAKSALPALAHLHIARLAGPTANRLVETEQVSRQLGEILLLMDDLVDLLEDWRRGTPNLLVMRLLNSLIEQGCTQVTDEALHRVIDETTLQIVTLLNSAEFAAVDTQLIRRYQSEQRGTEASGVTIPVRTISDLAMLTIGRQINWAIAEDFGHAQQRDAFPAIAPAAYLL